MKPANIWARNRSSPTENRENLAVTPPSSHVTPVSPLQQANRNLHTSLCLSHVTQFEIATCRLSQHSQHRNSGWDPGLWVLFWTIRFDMINLWKTPQMSTDLKLRLHTSYMYHGTAETSCEANSGRTKCFDASKSCNYMSTFYSSFLYYDTAIFAAARQGDIFWQLHTFLKLAWAVLRALGFHLSSKWNPM